MTFDRFKLFQALFVKASYPLRGTLKKTNSTFKDIIQIEVDPPPSNPIFDKFIFDKLLIMLTSLPPLAPDGNQRLARLVSCKINFKRTDTSFSSKFTIQVQKSKF